ncbi:MAG: hypothetical protein ACM3VT_15560 [Solirubrobacterales bacterium]
MNIDGISSDRYWALDSRNSGRSHRVETAGGEVRKKTATSAEETESPVVDTPDSEPSDTQEARGVIRLLQEGHFKGVADVRLRINFAEELAGSELPELSAPKGNGKAYEKFLQIYRDMQGTDEVETPDDTETPTDPVDTETPVDGGTPTDTETPVDTQTPDDTVPIDVVA